MTFVKTVTHNIRENHTQIFSDVAAAVKSYEAKDYRAAGVDIADIMVQTLGEFPPAAPQAPESLVLTQWWKEYRDFDDILNESWISNERLVCLKYRKWNIKTHLILDI